MPFPLRRRFAPGRGGASSQRSDHLHGTMEQQVEEETRGHRECIEDDHLVSFCDRIATMGTWNWKMGVTQPAKSRQVRDLENLIEGSALP